MTGRASASAPSDTAIHHPQVLLLLLNPLSTHTRVQL